MARSMTLLESIGKRTLDQLKNPSLDRSDEVVYIMLVRREVGTVAQLEF